MNNPSIAKLLVLSFALFSHFSVAQTANDTYQRDISDQNNNGIRDDIDREIIKYTTDLTEQQMLQHYAFFAGQFLKNTGSDLVHDYAEMLKIRYCLGHGKREAFIDIKARLMDTEEGFSQYMRAEKEVANTRWTSYVTRADRCLFQPLATGTTFEEYALNLYEQDICMKISQHGDNADPMLSEYRQQCEDAK